MEQMNQAEQADALELIPQEEESPKELEWYVFYKWWTLISAGGFFINAIREIFSAKSFWNSWYDLLPEFAAVEIREYIFNIVSYSILFLVYLCVFISLHKRRKIALFFIGSRVIINPLYFHLSTFMLVNSAFKWHYWEVFWASFFPSHAASGQSYIVEYYNSLIESPMLLNVICGALLTVTALLNMLYFYKHRDVLR